MEEDFIYQIKIQCEDGIELVIYTNGRKNEEIIILDFMYQKYWEFQPDISKYKVTSLSEEPNVKAPLNVVQFHLACRAFEYADSYN
jgi:hypothetical protein